MLFSKSSIVSGLTFRSLIHFEFIFMYDVRKCFNFILLHIAVQFSQHHLLKRLSYFLNQYLDDMGDVSDLLDSCDTHGSRQDS